MDLTADPADQDEDAGPAATHGRGVKKPDVALGPIIPELLEMKEELHVRIDALPLPPNFLDLLIDELGGPTQVTGAASHGSNGNWTVPGTG